MPGNVENAGLPEARLCILTSEWLPGAHPRTLEHFHPKGSSSALLTLSSALVTHWPRITFQAGCRAGCPNILPFSPGRECTTTKATPRGLFQSYRSPHSLQTFINRWNTGSMG